MEYHSTRGQAPSVGAAQAIFQGLAPDGGLYVPATLPKLPGGPFGSYAELSARVLEGFFGELGTLEGITQDAYARFSSADPAPLIEEKDGGLTLELYHGPTRAFKDMALQVLPGLMERARQNRSVTDQICILTATSGDTGKAALEGFAGREGSFVIVFYPKDGTSEVQRRQMTTQEGANVGVFAVEGNFDDAQTGVKRLFSDPGFRAEMASRGYALSAANSINIGRLIPQVAYYVHAYAEMVSRGIIRQGAPVNFCVPTGNFGNILAGLYAQSCGLPVGRLICASNRNRVLTDVLTTGRYDTNRDFYVTPSPSMDILISSNFERAVYHMSGGDCELTRGLMCEMAENRSYTLPETVLSRFREHFSAYACDDAEALEEIRAGYQTTGRMFDPHTAVARKCLADYRRETGDTTPTVVLATADPYKFPETMLKALGFTQAQGMEALKALSSATGTEIPVSLKTVLERQERFTGVTKVQEMGRAVLDLLRA